MTSRTSHQSTADEQGASFENDAPCGGARRRRPSDRLLKRFHLARVEALVDIDVLSDAQRDESPEDAAARSKEEARKASDRERQAAMRAEQKAKGNTHYNICGKDTEEAKTTLKAVADASVNDEALFSTFADFLADDFLREVVVSASVIRGRVGFLAEIADRHDIRKLAEAAAANPVLVDALFDLTAAEGDLLTRLAEVIRTANGSAAAGCGPTLVTRAVAVALQDPEAVLRIAAVRAGGGVGVRVANWLLGVR
jgi:hypothetical protein